ncbi:hypothetical protein [Phormidesmis priestleyi]
MINDDFAIHLHDKSTRGIVLSEQERTQLEQWYTVQDEMESAMLSGNQTPQTLQALQTQVDTTIAHIFTVTQKIQNLSAENEVRRKVCGT